MGPLLALFWSLLIWYIFSIFVFVICQYDEPANFFYKKGQWVNILGFVATYGLCLFPFFFSSSSQPLQIVKTIL